MPVVLSTSSSMDITQPQERSIGVSSHESFRLIRKMLQTIPALGFSCVCCQLTTDPFWAWRAFGASTIGSVFCLVAIPLPFISRLSHDCLDSFWTLASLCYSRAALLSAPSPCFYWQGVSQPGHPEKSAKTPETLGFLIL